MKFTEQVKANISRSSESLAAIIGGLTAFSLLATLVWYIEKKRKENYVKAPTSGQKPGVRF